MDLVLAFGFSFLLLLVSTLKGIFIAYPLAIAMLAFVFMLWRRGFALPFLMRQAGLGCRRALPVISVLFLIGVVIASWMAAGTVPALVYYGVQWIQPRLFLLTAFWLTSGVSLLIGTSFGTVGTIGLALMTMAQGSEVNPAMLAGAVIAGAYVGDRCSPMSSSALLIATVTRTRLYDNLSGMWRTSLLPLLLTSGVYLALSWWFPVHPNQTTLTVELNQVFQVEPLLLAPAIAILGLSLLKVDVRYSMLLSTGVAIALALGHQHQSPINILRFLIFGFHLHTDTSLDTILLGGGILSMSRVLLVVLLSTAFVGLFAGTRLLDTIHPYLARISNRPQRLMATGCVGFGSAAFGCTQTIAILLTEQLMRSKYEESTKGNAALALDLENTVVVLSPLIPWNIAGLVPATVLGIHAGFIPFACYLYLLPLVTLIHLRFTSRPRPQPCN
ncbi:MAG: Na+/H+ antiporter NhaC family protein [Cyanobacteria bacterium J06638_20]